MTVLACWKLYFWLATVLFRLQIWSANKNTACSKRLVPCCSIVYLLCFIYYFLRNVTDLFIYFHFHLLRFQIQQSHKHSHNPNFWTTICKFYCIVTAKSSSDSHEWLIMQRLNCRKTNFSGFFRLSQNVFGGFPLADNYTAGRLTGIVNMLATSTTRSTRWPITEPKHRTTQSQPTAACSITPHPALYR